MAVSVSALHSRSRHSVSELLLRSSRPPYCSIHPREKRPVPTKRIANAYSVVGEVQHASHIVSCAFWEITE